jgi:hypothetical protein
MKIYQVVQKLLVGGHADRQTDDLISLLSSLEVVVACPFTPQRGLGPFGFFDKNNLR